MKRPVQRQQRFRWASRGCQPSGFTRSHPQCSNKRKQPAADGENSQSTDSVDNDCQLAFSCRKIGMWFSRVEMMAAVVANDRFDNHRPDRPQIPRPRAAAHAVSAALGTTPSAAAPGGRIARQHFVTETTLTRYVLNHLATERALFHLGTFSDRSKNNQRKTINEQSYASIRTFRNSIGERIPGCVLVWPGGVRVTCPLRAAYGHPCERCTADRPPPRFPKLSAPHGCVASHGRCSTSGPRNAVGNIGSDFRRGEKRSVG